MTTETVGAAATTVKYDNIVSLHAAVQKYAWGMTPESGSLVARLHALNTGYAIHDTEPYAELWMGIHKSGPTLLADDTKKTLHDLLMSSPDDDTPSDLPYLFKVLSVAKPLSIQAHPHKALAEQLHARNPKAYKDDNHKPEMCVALTEFEGMCNFRTLQEINAHLNRFADFANLCGGKPIIQAIAAAVSSTCASGGSISQQSSINSYQSSTNRINNTEPTTIITSSVDGTSNNGNNNKNNVGNGSVIDQKKKVLKLLFANLMNSDVQVIERALRTTLNIVRTSKAQPRLAADMLFERLCHFYPGDVGCFAAYLLNYIHIHPGEAFFMAANEPHAYLQGQCMEIMANSDNVVRAGLTPKFKDVQTLVDMLTYNEGPPVVMKGVDVDACTKVYQPPAKEFQLSRCVIPAGKMHTLKPAVDAGIVLCIGGSGWITLDDSVNGLHHHHHQQEEEGKGKGEQCSSEKKRKLPLCAGKVYYIPKNRAFTVMADESAVASQPSPALYFFRAGVNESGGQ